MENHWRKQTPCCSIRVHCGKGQLGSPIRGAGDEQSHIFECNKRQPMSNQGRAERVDTGLPSLTPHGPTRAVWQAGHWRAVRPRPSRPCEGFRREQPTEVCPGRPAGAASAGKEVIDSSLETRAPDVLRSPRGSAGVHPWPLCLRGGRGASLPRPSWCLSLARLVA